MPRRALRMVWQGCPGAWRKAEGRAWTHRSSWVKLGTGCFMRARRLARPRRWPVPNPVSRERTQGQSSSSLNVPDTMLSGEGM